MNTEKKTMRILVERDSVCLGDDCTAPNGEYIFFESGIRLSALLLQIAQYVPDYSGRQHTVWGIEYKGKPVAFLECDEHSKYKCILNMDDVLADTMNEEKVYCRYFFDYHGNVSTNLINVCSSKHSKAYTLFETLQGLNEAVEEFLPKGTIIIGSDGGSELYGVNVEGTYLNLPETMEEDYISFLGNDLNELPRKIYELWKNM